MEVIPTFTEEEGELWEDLAGYCCRSPRVEDVRAGVYPGQDNRWHVKGCRAGGGRPHPLTRAGVLRLRFLVDCHDDHAKRAAQAEERARLAEARLSERTRILAGELEQLRSELAGSREATRIAQDRAAYWFIEAEAAAEKKQR